MTERHIHLMSGWINTFLLVKIWPSKEFQRTTIDRCTDTTHIQTNFEHCLSDQIVSRKGSNLALKDSIC